MVLGVACACVSGGREGVGGACVGVFPNASLQGRLWIRDCSVGKDALWMHPVVCFTARL